MASEPPQPSSSSSPSSPPAAGSSAGESYIGSFISLISKYEIRYEGVLYYLNPGDSTLGLKNVRSCGTEGRKKDGPQIPPSDKVYEYILFRGNDIKDLQVKSPPSAQSKQEIPRGQDITQPGYSQPAMIPSDPGSVDSCGLVKSPEWMDTPAVTSKPFPATQHLAAPLSFSPPSSADARSLIESLPTLIGPSNNFQATQTNFVSSMPMPSFMQGHIGAPASGCLPMMHKPVSSPPVMQEQLPLTDPYSSPILGIVNDTSHLVTRASDPLANPPYANSSFVAQPLLSASAPISLSSFPASIQGSCSTGSQVFGKVYDSAFSQPTQFTSYELPVENPSLSPVNQSPLFTSHQFLGTEHLLQSTEQPFPHRQIVGGRGDMVAATKPISVDVLSRSPAIVNQTPLLPLPVSVQQSHKHSSSIQFTEEFDFEAMNEKFKKDEVWGFLGKNKLGDQTYDREDTAVKPSSEGKAKPAYNKDDFFDTISRNTINRGARSGHSHYSGRMRHDNETFGNVQGRPQLQPGDGGYLTEHANYRGGHNSGVGYGYYGGRGHVRNTHF